NAETKFSCSQSDVAYLSSELVHRALPDAGQAEAPIRTEPSTEANPLDAKFGFRDLRFGTPVAKVSGLKLIEAGPGGRARYYRRKGDSMKLGDAVLNSITYAFYKGEFSSVALETRGYINGQAMLGAFEASYGKGVQPNPYLEERTWHSAKT